jgi:hypothetical protein
LTFEIFKIGRKFLIQDFIFVNNLKDRDASNVAHAVRDVAGAFGVTDEKSRI